MDECSIASASPRFKRVLLKLSGEALLDDQQYGIDVDFLNKVAKVLVDLNSKGIELAIVVGGGNFWRGIPWCSSV